MTQTLSIESINYADSEAVDSPDYSPPGQVYTKVSDKVRHVFDTRVAVVEGPVTSAGVKSSEEQLLDRADATMYQAKREGGNRVFYKR